ncbi:unnamed protein product [Rhizophagus irregularis]|nr:unnamed protein product [Rhizophagus irregularis]
MWTPIFQEIGSNVDADIPGIRDIGSGVNTESQRYGKNQDSFEWASEDRKTKIRRVDFRRIDEPRFVSASRWIYRFRLSVSTFGSWALNIRISAFDYWALDIWVSSFDYWALDIRVSTFSSQALDMWVSTFGWVLDIWIFLWTSIEWVGFESSKL